MYKPRVPRRDGLAQLRADPALPKASRGELLETASVIGPERNPGHRDFAAKAKAEPGNAGWYEHDHSLVLAPRGAYGSYSWAMPAESNADGTWWPVEQSGGPAFDGDDDFASQAAHSIGFDRVPHGVVAALLETTGHAQSNKIAIISGGPVVADYRSSSPDDFSSLWFDVDPDDHLARERKARTSTAFEVRKYVQPCGRPSGVTSSGSGGAYAAAFAAWQAAYSAAVASGQTPPPPPDVPAPPAEGDDTPPAGEPADDYAIAWQLGSTPRDVGGYGFATFRNMDVHASFLRSGPFIHSSSKHKLASPGDAELRSMSLHTNAYYWDGIELGDDSRDGPFRFSPEPWPHPRTGEIPYLVERRFHPEPDHAFHCGPRKGYWEEFVRLPVTETPPCTPTKDFGALDADGNKARTYADAPRLFYGGKQQSQGIYFQPRPGLFGGRAA